MTSSSLALYHGDTRRWPVMSARACVLLDIADGKSERVAQVLRGKPGVVMADPLEGPPDVMVVLEAPQRLRLVKLTVQALASLETVIKELQLLPAQDD